MLLLRLLPFPAGLHRKFFLVISLKNSITWYLSEKLAADSKENEDNKLKAIRGMKTRYTKESYSPQEKMGRGEISLWLEKALRKRAFFASATHFATFLNYHPFHPPPAVPPG